MQFCRRCLYPANHPLGISFDAEGICSGCRVHEEKDRLDWQEREQRLKRIFDGYRGRTRGRHDCIVPVTGARDSFFIVHLVRNIYCLNPLLVVYNRHYNSRAGIYNIARLRTVFGCDIYTLTLAPAVVKRIMCTTLQDRGSFHWHAIAGQTVFPVQVSVRTRIPLIVWGAHQGLDQVGMFSHLDEVEMTRRYRREHDLMGLEAEDLVDRQGLSEPDLQPFFYPEDADLRRVGVRGIYLGNYIRWDSKAQHERMVEQFDYYMGPLLRTFDTYNDVDDRHYANIHDEIKLCKLGYGKATDHACREIRFGRLTRGQGIEFTGRYSSRPATDGEALAEFVGMSEQALRSCVDCHRDPRAWTRSNGSGWVLHDSPDRHPGGADLPGAGGCSFRTHVPKDFEGPSLSPQLLTRGYARE
jgi:N-acetyl sugar amidotransferase